MPKRWVFPIPELEIPEHLRIPNIVKLLNETLETGLRGAGWVQVDEPASTTEPDDEILERKRRLQAEYDRGATREAAALTLNVSVATVKRHSRELGLDWRIPMSRRRKR
jgi:hypothetical protein